MSAPKSRAEKMALRALGIAQRQPDGSYAYDAAQVPTEAFVLESEHGYLGWHETRAEAEAAMKANHEAIVNAPPGLNITRVSGIRRVAWEDVPPRARANIMRRRLQGAIDALPVE